MAAAAQQPVSAQVVGKAFVEQYYHILHHSPALVHKFYQNPSKLGRPKEDGSMSITTTMDAINEKILSLNYGELKAEIKSVDAQESFNAGVTVLVTGYLTGKDNSIRNFTQSFFLAPQQKGYYVLNDMFRYIENASLDAANEVLVSDVVHVDAPVTPEEAEPSPSQESVISKQMTVWAEEVNGEDADKPSDNGEVPGVEEEVPVAEVDEEVQHKVQMIVESDTKVEAPKKSYASIVMDMKESGVVFSSPAPSMQKSPPKSQVQQVNPTLPAASGAEVPGSGSDAVENGNNQEGEGDGYSIYIKGLPLNATPAQLVDEFKKFEPIKSGGIQVRSNRQQGVCFGFVKYEVESAVQKAMEASPITIGGRQAVIKEKRSTNSRGMAAPQENGHIDVPAPQENGHNQQNIESQEVDAYYKMKDKARQIEFIKGYTDGQKKEWVQIEFYYEKKVIKNVIEYMERRHTLYEIMLEEIRQEGPPPADV